MDYEFELIENMNTSQKPESEEKRCTCCGWDEGYTHEPICDLYKPLEIKLENMKTVQKKAEGEKKHLIGSCSGSSCHLDHCPCDCHKRRWFCKNHGLAGVVGMDWCFGCYRIDEDTETPVPYLGYPKA